MGTGRAVVGEVEKWGVGKGLVFIHKGTYIEILKDTGAKEA